MTRHSWPRSQLKREIRRLVDVTSGYGTTRVIDHLERIGVGVALDDFGTGYSSLSYLTLLRPRIIKIDRSFVSPPHESVYNETLLEAIVSLAHKLDMTVLAEGIETQGQLEHLRHLDCRLGQGFLFSPAVPASEVSQVLARFPGEWTASPAPHTRGMPRTSRP